MFYSQQKCAHYLFILFKNGFGQIPKNANQAYEELVNEAKKGNREAVSY